MNNTNILKAINLLSENNLQSLKTLLTSELLKTQDKKQANLFETVKNYLNKISDVSSILKTVQHKNGKQFICDGCSMAIFNDYIFGFETLINTNDESLCLDYEKILNQFNINDSKKINDDEIKIFKNIKKYVNYYKTLDIYKTDKEIIIPFGNKFFNAKYILFISNLYNNNIDLLKIINDENIISPILFDNDKIKSLILPIRLANDNLKMKILETYNSFINMTNKKKWVENKIKSGEIIYKNDLD